MNITSELHIITFIWAQPTIGPARLTTGNVSVLSSPLAKIREEKRQGVDVSWWPVGYIINVQWPIPKGV